MRNRYNDIKNHPPLLYPLPTLPKFQHRIWHPAAEGENLEGVFL